MKCNCSSLLRKLLRRLKPCWRDFSLNFLFFHKWSLDLTLILIIKISFTCGVNISESFPFSYFKVYVYVYLFIFAKQMQNGLFLNSLYNSCYIRYRQYCNMIFCISCGSSGWTFCLNISSFLLSSSQFIVHYNIESFLQLGYILYTKIRSCMLWRLLLLCANKISTLYR